MTKTIVALSMALGLLGATAASAQTTTPPATPPKATPPASAAPPSSTMPPSSAQKPMAPAEKQAFLSQKQSGQWLASEYMKRNVVGANNERIGEVDDLLISQNGDVEGVIIGVGGFLGIGEKSVAVRFEDLKPAPNGNQLMTQFTRKDLENAPRFVASKSSTNGNAGSGPAKVPGGTQK